MTHIFQTGRAEGKTTFAVGRVKELVAEGHPVLVVVAVELQVRHWVQRLADVGIDAHPWKATKVQVVTLHSALSRLRGGVPRGARIIAEDVESWDEGIHALEPLRPYAEIDLVTASECPVPELERQERFVHYLRRQRTIEARARKQAIREFEDWLMRAWMVYTLARFAEEEPHGA